jgi:hypothetical protein
MLAPNNNRGVTYQTDKKHLTNLPEHFVGVVKGLTICHSNETVQSTFLDGNLNPISNPTPPRTHPNWSGQPGVP